MPDEVVGRAGLGGMCAVILAGPVAGPIISLGAAVGRLWRSDWLWVGGSVKEGGGSGLGAGGILERWWRLKAGFIRRRRDLRAA